MNRHKSIRHFLMAFTLFAASLPLWTWIVLAFFTGVTDWLFPAMMGGLALTTVAWSQFWAGVEMRRQAEDEEWKPFKPIWEKYDRDHHRREWMEGGER